MLRQGKRLLTYIKYDWKRFLVANGFLLCAMGLQTLLPYLPGLIDQHLMPVSQGETLQGPSCSYFRFICFVV